MRLLVFIFLFVGQSYAGGFKLNFSNTDCSGFPDQATCDAALNTISDTFASSFNQTLLSDFLSASANANVMSSRSNFAPGMIKEQDYWITLNANLGTETQGGRSNTETAPGQNKLPGVGISAQAFATIGIPSHLLGGAIFGLDPNRLNYAVSFGGIFLKFKDIAYRYAHFGVGGSYLVSKPMEWMPLVGWSGIRASTGLVYSRTNIYYKAPIIMSATSGGVTALWNSNLDLELASDVLTLPTDFVTGIDLLNIFTVYGGLGFDLNVGGSKTKGNMNGRVVNQSNGLRVTNTAVDANSDTEKPVMVQIRTIIGFQFGIGPVAIHIQTMAANPKSVSHQLGLSALF